MDNIKVHLKQPGCDRHALYSTDFGWNLVLDVVTTAIDIPIP
jgi:hypothetical protein